jgi:hypothetical protein
MAAKSLISPCIYLAKRESRLLQEFVNQFTLAVRWFTKQSKRSDPLPRILRRRRPHMLSQTHSESRDHNAQISLDFSDFTIPKLPVSAM